MKLAILSPLKGAYSETFIQAQRDFLPFDVSFYTNGKVPRLVDGLPLKLYESLISRFGYHMWKVLGVTKFNFQEEALLKSFRKHKIDAVLAQYWPTGEAVWKVCKALDIPLIVHFHGYDASVNEVIEKNSFYRNCFKYASSIFAVSKKMETKLIEIGCPPEILSFHPCGPNDQFLNISPKFSSEHFIGLGRFTDKKAPYYTILAFNKVLKEFPEAQLTIGGDGMLFDTCVNLVKYLGIDHAVNLPGILTPIDFKEYLATSLAFVQHSIVTQNGDSEGTPVAVLEASAAGVPVISTNHAGIPDVIVSGVTGFLIKEHDINGMAEAMIKLLENKDLAIRMGAAGKERVKTSFTMQHYIDKLSDVIKNSVK